MRKIKRIVVSTLCMALLMSTIISLPVNAASIKPFAWPGRPGGTGTGSEEWLQGGYGEPNPDGQWHVLYQSTNS